MDGLRDNAIQFILSGFFLNNSIASFIFSLYFSKMCVAFGLIDKKSQSILSIFFLEYESHLNFLIKISNLFLFYQDFFLIHELHSGSLIKISNLFCQGYLLVNGWH